MASEYSQFTAGDYTLGDTWGENQQGLNEGQYQSLADALGYQGSLFADNMFTGDKPYADGEWSPDNQYNTKGYAAYLKNPTEPNWANTSISESDWLNPDFKNMVGGLRLQNSFDEDNNQNWNIFDQKNNSIGSFQMWKPPDTLDQIVSTLAPALVTGAFGGGLANLFGGGFLGGAAGHGLASGTMSSAQGGSFGKGFLSGAIGGGLSGMAAGTPAVVGNNPSAYVAGTPGTSIAGLSGITNPTLAGMVNKGAGSALGALATGKSGSEALRSGLTGAAVSGINSAGKGAMDFLSNAFKNLSTPDMGGSDAEFDSLMGSGGDMSGQTDVSPNRYEEMTTGSDNMQSYNPDYGFGGDQTPNLFSAGLAPQQSAQSAGQSNGFLSSLFGDAGGRVGNFALNNAGDLASMLYGFYNNRKQQKALGQQVDSLQGLYGQNSPYAQQLRNTLNAKAAATGRRSNVGGREMQLQAALADRYASLQPTMMQLNQARGGLKNNNMNMLLQGFNKMGGFNGLQQMFQQNPLSNYSMANNTSDYNTLGMEGNY